MNDYDDIGLGPSFVSVEDVTPNKEDLPDICMKLEARLYETEEQLRSAESEIRTLNLALSILKEFVVENGLDLADIGLAPSEKALKDKPQKLSPEEIREKNKFATKRQTGRHAISKEALQQPSAEEMAKIYQARIDSIKEESPLAAELISKFTEKKDIPAVSELPEKK